MTIKQDKHEVIDLPSTETQCGSCFNSWLGAPKDTEGCLLPIGHEGPHEFKDEYGRLYQWQYDVEDDSDIYWSKTQ